jgi:hypothetical protein
MFMADYKEKRTIEDRKGRGRAKPPAHSRKHLAGAAQPTPTRTTRYSVQSLMLGLDVLESLAFAGSDRGITELAAQLKTTKWQIFRHLHSLTEGGYVAKDPATGKFRIGRRTYSLIESLPHRFNFAREARAEMSALRDRLGHTVVLASAIDDTGVVVVDAIEGTHTVQFSLKIGAIFDLHASARRIGSIALLSAGYAATLNIQSLIRAPCAARSSAFVVKVGLRLAKNRFAASILWWHQSSRPRAIMSGRSPSLDRSRRSRAIRIRRISRQ